MQARQNALRDTEISLNGGNVTPVVRVGATVRRAAGPWTPAVHALLRHLETRGFDGAPRALGYDELGREVLSFLAGEVGHFPPRAALWTDEMLVAVARLIRDYHDATVDFVPPAGAVWQLSYPDASRHEVICHNDLAPHNTVYGDAAPVALLDFDLAGPGPRAWDLAYAAYRFVPLERYDAGAVTRADLVREETQAQRLQVFCSAYGIAPREVLALLVPRLRQLCATLSENAVAGNAAYQRMVAEGHLDHYRREIARLCDVLPRLADSAM